jgi:hypothetical protein
MSEVYTAVIFDREREVLGWTDKGNVAIGDGSQLALAALGGRTLSGRVWRIARLRYEDDKWWLDGRAVPTESCYFEDGKLFVDKREFPAAPLYIGDGHWWLNSQSQPTSERIASDKEPRFEIARLTHLETLSALAIALRASETWENVVSFRHDVVAVAWMKDSFVERSTPTAESPFATATDDPIALVDRILKDLERSQKALRKEPVEHPRPRIKGYLPHFLVRCDFIVAPQSLPSAREGLPDYFVSYADAAKYAKVNEKTVRNWKIRDWLHVEQDCRKIRIARADLDKCNKRQ